MADIQKMVKAIKGITENDRIGILDAMIDADWHSDHLKPDSDSEYDQAVVICAGELVLLDQAGKYSATGQVVDALTSDEEIADWQKEQILNWADNIKLSTFKPDAQEQEIPTGEDAYGFPMAD